MQLFLDTANVEEVRLARRWGILDGVTTNPTLLARKGSDWRRHAEAICQETNGPVSLEVVAATAQEMVRQSRELITFGPNVVVKLPMTQDGMIALAELNGLHIKTNLTLVFSPTQALLAAKGGATYLSAFVGRLDTSSHDGMDLVFKIMAILKNYPLNTKLIVASIRHPRHVLDAALLGAHVATVPFKVLKELFEHPLTNVGLAQFAMDWEQIAK